MSTRRATILAWSWTALILAVIATTIVLVLLNLASIHAIDDANLLEIVLPFGFAVLGGIVSSRLPRSPVGWVFLAISLANAIPGATLFTRILSRASCWAMALARLIWAAFTAL